MVKKLVSDARLKNLPLVQHIREAHKTDEGATSQCIRFNLSALFLALLVLPIFGLTPILMSNLASALRTSRVTNPVQHFLQTVKLNTS